MIGLNITEQENMDIENSDVTLFITVEQQGKKCRNR